MLAQKAGVPRHAFLDFMNQSVMGSTFTRYKAPAFVNLDFKVTFTPQLLRKDIDLGLDAGRHFEVPMPLASLTRDIVQTLIGRGMTRRGLRATAAVAGGVFRREAGTGTGARERWFVSHYHIGLSALLRHVLGGNGKKAEPARDQE